MNVNLDEIQKIVHLLLQRLKENEGTVVELNKDFYWEVPSENLYNPYKEPEKLDMGQLTDDWQEVHRLINEGREVTYDLKRVANIIIALSIEYPTAF